MKFQIILPEFTKKNTGTNTYLVFIYKAMDRRYCLQNYNYTPSLSS